MNLLTIHLTKKSLSHDNLSEPISNELNIQALTRTRMIGELIGGKLHFNQSMHHQIMQMDDFKVNHDKYIVKLSVIHRDK